MSGEVDKPACHWQSAPCERIDRIAMLG